MDKPSYLNFEAEKYSWKPDIDYRQHPEKYKVGKGEQGVLICEPYKSEIGPYWRFKNTTAALESSEKIFSLFIEYLNKCEFVGADMARKYLQMGYTRARRYANYKGGKKYDKEMNISSWNVEPEILKRPQRQISSIKNGDLQNPTGLMQS